MFFFRNSYKTLMVVVVTIIHWWYCGLLLAVCLVDPTTTIATASTIMDWNLLWNDSHDKDIPPQHNGGIILTVELSETPTFLCTEDDSSICTQRVQEQQQRVLQEFQTHFPGITLVASAGKIVNALFLRFPQLDDNNKHNDQHHTRRRTTTTSPPPPPNKIMDNLNIQGITHIAPHGYYTPSRTSWTTFPADAKADAHAHAKADAKADATKMNENIPNFWVGDMTVDNDKFCTTGKDIRVAVLDTGIDYTHRDLGGPGTRHAYRQAYGDTIESTAHTRRDGLFPTHTVVEGYDFIGETTFIPFLLQGETSSKELEDRAQPDDDPIDGIRDGHGTLVASTIVQVAPDAKLVAVKVCSDRCPTFALILGMEYALDPNQDGSMDDAVDIINMSLGFAWTSALSHVETVVLERAYSLGVLTVLAAGNNQNVAYIGGGFAKSPHSITVAATGPSTSYDPFKSGFVKSYSSRYPGENNAIKPDIAAPDGFMGARAKSGFRRSYGFGTSFSAPIISGAAALLKEKCMQCSPLALKSLLMNNAFRDIRYNQTSSEKAPITLVGSGEVRINKALDADFWAYDTLDVQPSVSLGLIDAASTAVIRRSIKIMSLVETTDVIQIDSVFRDVHDQNSGAVTISANPSNVTIGKCNEAIVELIFHIDASKAPNNYFGHSRDEQATAFDLDKNEFDGHIILTSSTTRKDISLPFHMLLRKASNTTISSAQKRLPWKFKETSSTTIEITNNGAGVAQIDAFNLIAISPDKPEGNVGEPRKDDFRSIGFRSRNIDWQGCKSIFEFSINTWERHDHFNPIGIIILFDTDRDGILDYELALFQEVQKIRSLNGDVNCNSLPYDDASNTANTLIRVCSADIGNPDVFDAQFGIFSAPFDELSISDTLSSKGIQSSFSAPSHDILPKGVFNLTVSGSGAGTGRFLVERPLGLQITTNANRGYGKTGASTIETETHLLMVEGWEQFEESTPDQDHTFAVAEVTTGPECSWKRNACKGTPSPTSRMEYPPSISPAPTVYFLPEKPLLTETPTCEMEVLPVEDVPKTTATPTSSPSVSTVPTGTPSTSPSVSNVPTGIPSTSPSVSNVPTGVPSTSPSVSNVSTGVLKPTLLPQVSSSSCNCWKQHQFIFSILFLPMVFMG